MRPKLPRITATQLLRALRRDGWESHHQVGSHLVLRHPTRPGRVVVPVHAGHIIGPGLLAKTLKDAGMTDDDLRRLL